MFNFLNFIEALLGFNDRDELKEYRFSFGFFLKRTLFFIVLFSIIFVNHLFFLVDEIFLFIYRRTTIEKPILIIGVPRSGTTFLFRTLAKDKENFTCFSFAEILFAPSLFQKFILYGFYRLDKLVGSPLRRLLSFVSSRLNRDYQKIHAFGLFNPEEDELLLLNIFSSSIFKYLFPKSKVFDKYIAFDEKLSAGEIRNIINFKKRCIKKHIFFWQVVSGKKRTFLSKNPIYSPKVNSIMQAFPDMRLIITQRNMDSVIPSFISMSSSIIRSFHRSVHQYPGASLSKRVISEWDKQLMSKVKIFTQERVIVLPYNDFTEDVKSSAISVYKHFGLGMREEFLQYLSSKKSEQRSYSSQHQYNIQEMNKVLDEPLAGI